MTYGAYDDRAFVGDLSRVGRSDAHDGDHAGDITGGARPPSMRDVLAERRAAAIRRCADEAAALGRSMLYGMTTSLELQSVPLPTSCDLDMTALHSTASEAGKRVRRRAAGESRQHVWTHIGNDAPVRIRRNVYALDLFHTWAQLSPHVPLADLVMLGDAILSAKHGDDANRDSAADGKAALAAFVGGLTRFSGVRQCRRALKLVESHVLSPKETDARLAPVTHGIPQPVTNYVVPGAFFDSGTPMTVDLAWPEYQVAVEYDGDHHRTDRSQWHRDRDKRGLLQSRGWVVLDITADMLANEAARAEYAFRLARLLASRGAVFDFRVVAMPLERLADLMP